MPRILIESESSKQLSDGETIRIEASAVRYLRAVLRLRVGDELTLFDGCGTEYEGRIREATTKSVLVEVLGSKRPDREPGRQVFLAQAHHLGHAPATSSHGQAVESSQFAVDVARIYVFQIIVFFDRIVAH